jgi:multidrug resistance efflux pump
MTPTNQRAVEELEQALKVAQRDMEDYFQRATKAEARVAEQSAAGFSWDGHMVHGDRTSIEAVKQSLTTRTPGWRPISEEQVEAAADAIGRLRAKHSAGNPDSFVRKYRAENIELARAALSSLPPPPGEG